MLTLFIPGAGISVKVDKIAEEAREALAAGQCVVIGLQTTGESALEDHLAKSRQSLGGAEQFEGFISVTKFIVKSFIETHFPTTMVAQRPALAAVAQYMPDGSQLLADGSTRQVDGSIVFPDGVTPPAQQLGAQDRAHLVDLKKDLLAEAEALVLPPSPLDDLMHAHNRSTIARDFWSRF